MSDCSNGLSSGPRSTSAVHGTLATAGSRRVDGPAKSRLGRRSTTTWVAGGGTGLHVDRKCPTSPLGAIRLTAIVAVARQRAYDQHSYGACTSRVPCEGPSYGARCADVTVHMPHHRLVLRQQSLPIPVPTETRPNIPYHTTLSQVRDHTTYVR